ncbi:MAG: hypothetical protein IJU65_00265 [Desulfovibrio sp.]|nr:hypothetical protein [Desulfovibrio sp.]
MYHVRPFSLAILTIALLASGCAGKYGTQTTAVNYYPACYRPIQDLRTHEHDVAKGTAGGAALGALGGAALGFLLSGGKWQGAVTGAAVGGVAGGVTGNIYASKQKEADENKRMASYLQDIDGDISNLDVVGAAARASLQCYDRQFASLIADIKAKRVTRDVAQRMYAEIASGREEAISLMGNAVTNGRNLDQQYEAAFVSEERALSARRTSSSAKNGARRLRTARQQQQVLNRKVNDLAKEKTDAERISSANGEAFRRACEDYADSKA